MPVPPACLPSVCLPASLFSSLSLAGFLAAWTLCICTLDRPAFVKQYILYIQFSVYLSLSLYIYIYIYMYVCMYVYIYMYMYVYIYIYIYIYAREILDAVDTRACLM